MATTPKLTLQDFVKQEGLNVDYRQIQGKDGNNNSFNRGLVTLSNPNTGFSTAFEQGQGLSHGVGEFSGGRHYVTDMESLRQRMNTPMPKTDQTTGKAPYEYNQKFLTDDTVNRSLSAIQQQFGYDPSKDSALHMAQNQAKDAVKKYMARSGMLYSDSAKVRMQKEAQSLIPQYEDRAYQRFQDERQNQYNLLAQKAQLEGLNYNQFKDLQNFEVEQYGTVLTPEMRKHIQTYSSLPEEMKRDLEMTYGRDYHAEINRRKSINPRDELIPILESMRANKILKDPNMMTQYGSQYGIATPALAERGMQYDTTRMQRDLAAIELKYAEPVKKAEYQKIKLDLEAGQYQNAMLKIQAANFPRQMELELAQMAANLAQTQKSTALMGSGGGSGGSGGGGGWSGGGGSNKGGYTATPQQQQEFKKEFEKVFQTARPYAILEQLLGSDKESFKNAMGVDYYYEALNKANKMANEWDKIQAY